MKTMAAFLVLLAGATTSAGAMPPAPLAHAPIVLAASADEIREAQTLLSELGHDPGPIDGLVGPRVRRAIESFQRSAGLRATGAIDAPLLRALREAAQPAPAMPPMSPEPQATPRGGVTLTVTEPLQRPRPAERDRLPPPTTSRPPTLIVAPRTPSPPTEAPPVEPPAPQPDLLARPAETPPPLPAPEPEPPPPTPSASVDAPPEPPAPPPQPQSTLIANAPGFAAPTSNDGAAPATLIGQTWRFVDDNAAEMELTFQPAGRIDGPSFADGLSWSREGDVVWVLYETALGGRSARRGRFTSGDAMRGEGESNRAGASAGVRRWTWRAVRVR